VEKAIQNGGGNPQHSIAPFVKAFGRSQINHAGFFLETTADHIRADLEHLGDFTHREKFLLLHGTVPFRFRDYIRFINLSHCRRLPKLTNLTVRRFFVNIDSPVNGIFLRIPGLCRTENLPKLPSFKVNPSTGRLLSSVSSSAATTVSTIISACFFVGTANAC
jgi:hypothetical protein